MLYHICVAENGTICNVVFFAIILNLSVTNSKLLLVNQSAYLVICIMKAVLEHFKCANYINCKNIKEQRLSVAEGVRTYSNRPNLFLKR